MKKTLFIALLTASSFALSHGATTITGINALGGGAGFAQQIHLGGVPFVDGIYRVGTFTTTLGLDGPGPISLSDFGWSEFGTQAFSANAIAPGVYGAFVAPGQSPSVRGDLPTTATGPFIGNNIFVVIAAPGDSEFIIMDSGQQFVVEDALLGGPAVSIASRDSTLIRGAIVVGGNTGLGGPLGAYNGADAITFIPEPSVALLGAFGLLGLLRRRR